MESHLLGAYSYAASASINFLQTGILQVGAWNYLREEITVALIQRRGVRMGGIFDGQIESHLEDILPSDIISYLLGKIINFSFTNTRQKSLEERLDYWASLRSALEDWNRRLAPDYSPFSSAVVRGNPFPSVWMLQPCHSKCIFSNNVYHTILLTDRSQ